MIYFPVRLQIKGAPPENEGKMIHWEGVEPPPLALELKLEGKDDNRFTTSVTSGYFLLESWPELPGD